MSKKSKNKRTRHHIIPTSRGGKNLESNLAWVPRIQHQKYHSLFGNRNPDEIINYLVKDFWKGDSNWIDIYIQRYYEPNRPNKS